MTAVAVVLACAALAFAYAAWERAGVTAKWAGSKAADEAAKVRVDALFGAMRDQSRAIGDIQKLADVIDTELNQAQDTIEDHGRALQDVRAELVNQKDTRANPASESTCNRPE